MKQHFGGYFPLSPEELDDFWQSCEIVLDTNVVLNLYRYSAQPRQDLLASLEVVKEKLWMPHQVAQEFFNQRDNVIHDLHAPYDDVLALVSKFKSDLESKFRGYGRFGLEGDPELVSQLDSSLRPIVEYLNRARDGHAGNLAITHSDDALLAVLARLYESRVGSAFDDEVLDLLYSEAEVRYEKRQPPGYKDAGKSQPARYGDYILWKQLLEKYSSSGKDLIFVTDDLKEDWWHRPFGETVGPRPELVADFHRTVGGRLHLMRPSTFVRWVTTKSGQVLTPDSIDEIEATSSESEKRERIERLLQKRRESASHRVESALRALDLSERAIETERDILVSADRSEEAEVWLNALDEEREALENAVLNLKNVPMEDLDEDDRVFVVNEFRQLDKALARNRDSVREAKSLIRGTDVESHANARLSRHRRLAATNKRRLQAAREELNEIDVAVADLRQFEERS